MGDSGDGDGLVSCLRNLRLMKVPASATPAARNFWAFGMYIPNLVSRFYSDILIA